MEQRPLQTVVETGAYLADAKKLLSDEERSEVVNRVAEDPICGALIVGGGGIRKVRHAIGSKGKSGGVRVIYYYHSGTFPAFLLAVFGKGERSDLSDDEVNNLAKAVKVLVSGYRVIP